MTAQTVAKTCSAVRLSQGGRVWACVLPEHGDENHYMTCSEIVEVVEGEVVD